ncbi:MAG TPA: monovalent cation/H+ antiporter complex subunit F [Polyangiaceae bacterium]
MNPLTMLCLYLLMPALGVAILLACVRLLRGPSLPDRVVALDLLVSLGIGIVVSLAIAQDEPALLDVAVILAIAAFLGTVAFARYVEQASKS